MPPTAYQQRLKALWEGNPLANFGVQEEDAVLSPTAYNVKSPTDASADVTSPAPMLTQTVGIGDNYKSAIRNRLTQISGMSQDATARAMAQQQARQQATANSAYTMPAGGSPTLTGNKARDAILNAARGAVGLPYSWGGGTAKGASYGIGRGTQNLKGFDCSGLVLYAYSQIGIKMSHSAGAQARMGVRAPINKLVAGDLVGAPGHIAIYAGNGMMYEAPTFGKRVRLVPVRRGMFGVHFNL